MSETIAVYRRILVGVDGSDHSVAALRHASILADAFGAELTVVMTWTFPPVYTGFTESMDPEADARTVLDETFVEVWPQGVPANVTTRILPGPAAGVLIEQSKHADLLVVGSRGHGGFVGLLLGSVSAQCAEHAHCPVLVHH
ncbi:universal stress protein [Microbacterium aureliae]